MIDVLLQLRRDGWISLPVAGAARSVDPILSSFRPAGSKGANRVWRGRGLHRQTQSLKINRTIFRFEAFGCRSPRGQAHAAAKAARYPVGGGSADRLRPPAARPFRRATVHIPPGEPG